MNQPNAVDPPDSDQLDQPSPEEQQKARTTGAALGLGGGAVLLISLFLNWYKDDLSSLPAAARGGVEAASYTAFEGLERTDVMIAVVAGLAILAGIAALGSVFKNVGAVGWTLTALGLAGALLVLYRGSERPEPKFAFGIETSLQFGWYLALVSSLVVVAGGVVALRKRTRRPREDWEDEEDEGTEPAV
jgi:hypothetical protein